MTKRFLNRKETINPPTGAQIFTLLNAGLYRATTSSTIKSKSMLKAVTQTKHVIEIGKVGFCTSKQLITVVTSVLSF